MEGGTDWGIGAASKGKGGKEPRGKCPAEVIASCAAGCKAGPVAAAAAEKSQFFYIP
eukprot:m.27060 g.27060  ORF g.27060 m.27060 type:complete len:57 (+) comp29718_c0_seq1:56-226(+)